MVIEVLVSQAHAAFSFCSQIILFFTKLLVNTVFQQYCLPFSALLLCYEQTTNTKAKPFKVRW